MPDSLFGDVDYEKNECVMSSGPGGGSAAVHARASEPVNQTHPVDCWRQQIVITVTCRLIISEPRERCSMML